MNYEQLENELLEMGYGNCGNNGDWSVDAWCLSNGIPNRHNAGIYLLDSENGTYSVVQRFYDKCDRDGNDTIELLIEFDSIHTVFVWMQVLQMFCQNKPYPMVPFEFEGMTIANPEMDETGRFEAESNYYNQD